MLMVISVNAQNYTDTLLQYETYVIKIPGEIDFVEISEKAHVEVSFKDSSISVSFTTSNMPQDSIYIHKQDTVLKYYFLVKANNDVDKTLSDFTTPEQIKNWQKYRIAKFGIDTIIRADLIRLKLTDIYDKVYTIPENNKPTFLLLTSRYCLPCMYLKPHINFLKEEFHKMGIDNFYCVFRDSLLIKNDTLWAVSLKGFPKFDQSYLMQKKELDKNLFFDYSNYKEIEKIIKSNGVPTGLLVDENGEVQSYVIGFSVSENEEVINKALKRWLFLPKVHYFHLH